MRTRYPLLVFLVLLPTMACVGTAETEPSPDVDLTEIRLEYSRAADALARSLPTIAAPLQNLTEEQMASVAALVAMTRVATRAERVGSAAAALEGFWVELPEICPPLPQNTMDRFGGCMDEEIAYASSMASCEAEGKSEDECERESAPELAAAVNCTMKELEALRNFLREIPGRVWPPDPIPWPEREPR